MEILNTEEAKSLSASFAKDRASFHINPFFLTHCYKEERNGETILFEEDDVVKGTFDAITVPKLKENSHNQCYIYLFEEDITSLKKLGAEIKTQNLLGPEYFYKTEDFVKLDGSDFSRFRKKVNRFVKDFHPVVLNEYPKEKIKQFILNWATAKDTCNMSLLQKEIFDNETKSSLKYIDLLETIENKTFYVEIDNQLAGFRITCPLTSDLWCGITQKIDYKYKNLNKYLYHISAKEYENIDMFTTGGDALMPSLGQYKESMHPNNKRDFYFIVTK